MTTLIDNKQVSIQDALRLSIAYFNKRTTNVHVAVLWNLLCWAYLLYWGAMIQGIEL